MSPRWESNAFAKIHEGCGGLVQWVEAYDDPHVGYTGECIECGDDRVVVEEIIPLQCGPDEIGVELVNDVDLETLAELEWDDSAEWNNEQARLQRKIE